MMLASLVGCERGPARFGVSGTVKFKGERLADGWITFVPKDAAKETQGARITEGKYELPAANGLTLGEYLVAITAMEPGAKAGADEPPGAPKRGKSIIPEEFNRNTKLGIEISSDGKRVFDFDLD